MLLPPEVVLVCVGADIAIAEHYPNPRLHLCLGLDAAGMLTRTTLPKQGIGQYLGLSDSGFHRGKLHTDAIVAGVLYELQRTHGKGLFADFESDEPAIHSLLTALDDALHKVDLPLFVPENRAQDTQHAVITLSTPTSGDSLRERFRQAIQEWGITRTAALFEPVSADYILPGNASGGTPLDDDARRALQEEYHAQVFFSAELCAKYFTYMDAREQGHFVLFDDASTFSGKYNQLSTLGIRNLFLLVPNMKNFCLISDEKLTK